MQENYIPLRVNRDFGEIVTVYFDFFKQNLKKFSNIFLRYNGLFLIGLLITSYLLVSGFIGFITVNTNSRFEGAAEQDQDYILYLVGGGILFLVIFIMIAILNYSLASSYMINYIESKGNNFEDKKVWDFIKQQLGNILIFILLLVPLYFVFLIVSFIFLIIPIIGMLFQYALQFFITAWVGVSFFDMLHNKKSVVDALGEGWHLVSKNFWKSVGVNFVLGLLLGILLLITLMVPGILIGIYTFHIVENNVDFEQSTVSTVIYTLGTCLVLIIAVYGQCLSQFVNGILYYALHEKTYNINTQKIIDQIGQNQ